MTSAIPFPVTFVSSFNGAPRIANDCLELTLHTWAPGSLATLYELVEAELPCTAHVSISSEGVISLVSVQCSDSVQA